MRLLPVAALASERRDPLRGRWVVSPSRAAIHISPATGCFQRRSLRGRALRRTPPAGHQPHSPWGPSMSLPFCPGAPIPPSWPGALIPPCRPGAPPHPSPASTAGPLSVPSRGPPSPRLLPCCLRAKTTAERAVWGGFWARARPLASAPAPEAQDADLMSPFLSSPPAPFSRERSPYRTWACRVTPGGLHLLPASSGPQPHLSPFSLLSFGKTNQVARLEKISPVGCLLQASHEPHCSCGPAT